MRIGSNPKKVDNKLQGYGAHRVIMPVYIPNLEGYFAQALDVLQICLDSLRLTKKPGTTVTIIANGCCEPVKEFLISEQSRGWVDQLVINSENRGKIDSIIGAARSCFEPAVTFSDSDVMFRPGWDAAIERIFSLFPECGFVFPCPIPDTECSFTSAPILAGACARAISFERVADPTEVETFHRSIGRPIESLALLQLGQLVFTRGSEKACVGGGHFVCSLRREVFKGMPSKPALQAMGGNSEAFWFDSSPDRLGYWKLSTTKAYVQHMGNCLEPYMIREIAALRAQPPVPSTESVSVEPMRRHWTAVLPYWLRVRLGARLGRWLRDSGRQRAARNASRYVGHTHGVEGT